MQPAPFAHRVFVIWSNPIFYESVRLLLRHPGVEMVGAASDPSSSSGSIQELQPEAVIWERIEDREPDGSQLTSILEVASAVLCFSLASNQVRVYRLQKKFLARAEDLLDLILGRSPATGLPEAT